MQAIAVLPPGLEILGSQELIALGAKSVRPLKRCVAFRTDMACLYRLHLQARLPFRILREIARFSCKTPEDLYVGVQRAFDWERWLHPSMTFRVDVSGRTSGLNHSHFSALQVKNALVDLQRNYWRKRSDINLDNPDLSIHLHLSNQGAILSLDGAGKSLHRRGYRAAMGAAPLKENLAAGLIGLTDWDVSVPLVDPMCGSGTLLIEAVSTVLGLAPGLNRSFLLEGWADFVPSLWDEEQQRAKRRRNFNVLLPSIIGCERDAKTLKDFEVNIESAGMSKFIQIQQGDFRDLKLPDEPGVIVCNPPYGERLGNEKELHILYKELGEYLKKYASGWQFWILSGNAKLTQFLRMKCNKRIPISNGDIDCRWLNYSIH